MLKKDNLLRLVKKYNVPGPRYTSYPTALQFSEDIDRNALESVLKKRSETPSELSLYFHIPFCFSLCWYCGCTKIITRDQDRGDIYLDYLEKEMKLNADRLHNKSVVRQIHFGGGTPTFLTPVQLLRLGQLIHDYFSVHPNAEFSVEIDPRRCTEDHIIALKEIGCNRASLGVQDTNPEVQEAIHRIQPFGQTADVTRMLRKHGIDSINFDLIYGLPKQTLKTFSTSLEQVLTLNPDRLAIYSYAHVPSIMPAQKLLHEKDFPSTEEKLSMMVHAITTLPDLDYDYIGMDHFAKKTDELGKALNNGSLQRNFQGYSTHAELEMIALGMSGISQGQDVYYQNQKDLAKYYSMLDDGKIPIAKVLPLSPEDKLRKKIIMQIMCQAGIQYNRFFRETGVNIRLKFSRELERLHDLEADGLLLMLDSGLKITSTGRLFLRNVAMVFDGYLGERNHKKAYSKTI